MRRFCLFIDPIKLSIPVVGLAASIGLTACGGGGSEVAEPMVADQVEALAGDESTTSNRLDTRPGEREASDALWDIAIPDGNDQSHDTATALAANATGRKALPVLGERAAPAGSCTAMPTIPLPPSNAKLVTSYGAVPNDNIDDTAAIQNALNSLKAGEWLVFPPGKYLHNNMLRLRNAGATLYGKGATLHATNPESMALMISADNSSVYSFTLTAVTDIRRSDPWNARISVFKDDTAGKKLPTYNVIIQGNTVTYAGAPGTPTANSASSAGIFVYKGIGFLVAQNSVARSLADGIHVTAGSHNGKIVQNKVRETGDDMIAVVSYAQGYPAALQTASALLAKWDSSKQGNLSTNILISQNDVAGNYWGRGITVVGGEDVTISSNKISSVAGGAGIYLVREQGYRTFGVNNVLVENNAIEKIQSVPPVYNPGNKFVSTTRQGSIESSSYLFDDEIADPFLREQLSVRNVITRGNSIKDAITGGVRVGAPLTGNMSAIDPLTGKTVYRHYQTHIVSKLSVDANILSSLSYGLSMILPGSDAPSTSCSGNMFNGALSGSPNCLSSIKPAVVGASLSCGATGLPF